MTTTTAPASLAERSADYLTFLERWLPDRPVAQLTEIIAAAGGPQHVAVVVVDLTNGFCHQGPLSSPRVAALLPRAARLLTAVHTAGVRAIVLPQDAHAPDAQEFGSFPPHCVRDTAEALTAPELSQLPFAGEFTVVPKNSISSTIATGFDDWDARGGPYAAYIIVGDCTDLCIYQAATALKLRGNARRLRTRVIVPVDCVDTYDIPLSTARANGAEPHPADLIHHVFLHSLATNGVEIVASIQ
jgi:nicotinamidase-related amidase